MGTSPEILMKYIKFLESIIISNTNHMLKGDFVTSSGLYTCFINHLIGNNEL